MENEKADNDRQWHSKHITTVIDDDKPINDAAFSVWSQPRLY
jgi:hypothetical protein